MKKEFIDYMEIIGMPKVFIDRAGTIHDFFNMLYPETIDDIFIEDYIDDEGSRIYKNLVFYTKSAIVFEVENFITEEKYSIFSNCERILWYDITKSNYDFIEANEKSRLYIELRTTTNSHISLKASKENCNYLRDIFNKYFKHKI